jgi:hypothetical protein
MAEREPIPQKVNFKLGGKETVFNIDGHIGSYSSDPWNSIFETYDTVWVIEIAQTSHKEDTKRIANINVVKDPMITDYHLEISYGLELELSTPSSFENPWQRLAKESPYLIKDLLFPGIKHARAELEIFLEKKIIDDMTSTGPFDDRQLDEQILKFATPIQNERNFEILFKHIPIFVDMVANSSTPSAKEILEMAVEGKYNVNVEKDETGMLIDRYTNGHSIVQARLYPVNR